MIERRDIERLIKLLEDIKELTHQVARVAYALERQQYSSDPLYKMEDPCRSCGCMLIDAGAAQCPCCRTAVLSEDDGDDST